MRKLIVLLLALPLVVGLASPIRATDQPVDVGIGGAADCTQAECDYCKQHSKMCSVSSFGPCQCI